MQSRSDGKDSGRETSSLCRGATWLCWTSLAIRTASSVSTNRSRDLRAERLRAEDLWQRGQGLLWFQHFRRAGGTSLCHLLRAAVPPARFLENRGEACQPEEWRLRDAMAMCEHNVSLIALELRILGGNAFAQEYGAVPGPDFIGHRARRYRMRHWVFVATMRDPWSRFWSQLRYEMATCLTDANALARCVGGNFFELGHWWSPTAHPDSILGVPQASISSSPAVYVDNYYTRVLLNRTDMDGPPLTTEDLYEAMDFVEERASGVVIMEDFAKSALQLKCTLGLDLAQAQPLLHTRVRPYQAHEALMEIPAEEERLGRRNINALRSRFVQKNSFDYALYAHAKLVAKRRLASCSRRHTGVEELRRAPPETVEVPHASPLPAVAGDALPPEISVDDLFGCSGGAVEVNDKGEYMLKCPRNMLQHASSWWSSEDDRGEPKRKRGQKMIGAECWQAGFSWSSCCAERFGPRGNRDCWDGEFTFKRCCKGK